MNSNNSTFYHRHKQFIFIVLLALLGLQQLTHASRSKEELKAAYLYQFVKFSQWQQPADEIVIGIVSQEHTASQFNVINGNRFAGKVVKIVWVLKPEDLSDCCAMVFFANDKINEFERYFDYVKNKPILTVLDHDYNGSHQGMIRFVQRGTKLKFLVDNSLAQSQAIKLSAFLLQVAIKVE